MFQWGWGRAPRCRRERADRVGDPPGALRRRVRPSTDYEVFLMTRIREEYDELGDAREAVAVAAWRRPGG
ncbi:MAG: hypothetical protein U5R31_06265 [Acidimicrobiia bacterium]|nr:hypothetical protein [Acidimicrobiia bacterium]